MGGGLSKSEKRKRSVARCLIRKGELRMVMAVVSV